MAVVISSATHHSVPKPPPAALHLPSLFRRCNYLPLRCSPKQPVSSEGSGSTGDWSIEHRIQESLAILEIMESQSITPDAPLLCSILNRCADARSLPLGRATHEKALTAGLHTNIYVANSLLLFYSQCCMIPEARKVFDEMPVRNVVSWTTAISMYHHAGFTHEALNLYQLLCDTAASGVGPVIKPNAYTYTVVLNCCADLRDFKLGLRVHEQIVDDLLQEDNFIIVALIDMYTKCGYVSHARNVFDSIPNPSIEAYTAMIEGYSGNGQPKEAVDLIRHVLKSGPVSKMVTDLGFTAILRPIVTKAALWHGQEIHAHIIKLGHVPVNKPMSALLKLYVKCDKMIIAYRVFDGLEVKEPELWRRLLSGFVRNGFYAEALMVYAELTSFDHVTSHSVVTDALKACVGMNGLSEGRQIHGLLIKAENLMGSTSLSVLAELYSSFEEYEDALKVKRLIESHYYSNKRRVTRVGAKDSCFR